MRAVPFARGALQKQLAILHACVVDQYPRCSVAGDYLRARAHDRRLVREIHVHGVGAAAALTECRGRASGACLVAIGNHDARAGLGHNGRDAHTDTARAARDDYHLGVEVEGIGCALRHEFS
jgi:hypothetical protein